ncbi:MAG TPA: hypothetical protein VH374_16395 [Polyangia bacterium]|jgi:hypothetical protein|nr:hypothetical protein [Polyangia bacterium]
MQAATEVAIAGGFRRTSPLPPPSAAIRLRAQLLTAAQGRPDHIARGLESLVSWRTLRALLAGPWFGDGMGAGSSTPARWTIEKRLSLLGTPPGALAEALLAASGTPVKLHGIARCLRRAGGAPLSDMRTVWENSTRRGPDVCLLVEEGHDFLLTSPDGGVLVLAQGGQLVGGGDDGEGGVVTVADGDAVQVLGFVDRVVDPAREEGAAPRSPALRTVVRSGDEVGLLMWKLP